jgi:hypothetical protein
MGRIGVDRQAIMCRTLERNGQTFAALPAAMILEAVHLLIETQNK